MINEKELSTFRRYYLEFSVFILAIALGFTVRFVIKLNDNFFHYVTVDRNEGVDVLRRTVNVLERTSTSLDKNTELLNSNNELLREKSNQFLNNKNTKQ